MKLKTFILGSCCLMAIGLSVPFALTSCGKNRNLMQKILPSVKQYTKTSNKKFVVSNSTRFVLDSSSIDDLDSASELSRCYFNKLKKTKFEMSDPPSVVSSDNIKVNNGDIILKIVNEIKGHKNVSSNEIYKIEIGSHITISALTNRGLVWGLTTILQMHFTNQGLYYGTIVDWPKIEERGIQYDMSGRGFDINFLKETIRQLSWDKMDALGMQIASGGMHVCMDGYDSPNDKIGPHTNVTITDDGGSSQTFNICENYSDHTTTWDWTSDDSEFAQAMKLAQNLGVKVIPQMEMMTHANYIVDLNAPRYQVGDVRPVGKNIGDIKNDEDITDSEREADFAFYDDNGESGQITHLNHRKRYSWLIDLSGKKAGSRNAIKIMKAVVQKVALKFHDKFGCDTFGIGSDEYLDSILWQPDYFINDTTKHDIVDGFYRVTSELSAILKNMGMTVRQWNDDLLRNIRNQEPKEVFPSPTQAQIDSLDKDEYSQYWWKSKPTDAKNYGGNAVASVDDWLGQGFHNMVNYDFDDLYVCDDPYSSIIPNPYNVFYNWHPGKFAKNWEPNNYGDVQEYKEDKHGNYPTWIKGAMISVWQDWYNQLLQKMQNPLKAVSEKCWNGSDYVGKWRNYEKTANEIGYAPYLNYL